MRRWVAVAAALALAAALAAWWRHGPRPAGQRKAAAGVIFAHQDVSGWDGVRLMALVNAFAADGRLPAAEPQIEPRDGGLVPGAPGLAVDVPATVAAILAAPPEARPVPVWRPVPPRKSLASAPLGPIYHGNRRRMAVALVINVAWGDEWVGVLLQILRESHVKATWCLVGRWAEERPHMVREIALAGHELCNHGYDDSQVWGRLTEAEARESIAAADRAIQAASGGRLPRWFSPHKGEWNPAVLRAARALGRPLVLWSLDTVDWKNPDPRWVVERIVPNAQPGDIVLMHPTSVIAQALPEILRGIRARGLEPTTLGNLLDAPAPQPHREPKMRAQRDGRIQASEG